MVARALWLAAASIAQTVVCCTRLGAQTGCEPVAQRGSRELGCYITARQELGSLPRDTLLYWHIDSFPGLAAAEAARAPRSSVVQSLGASWLFTIAEKSWQAPAGHHVAVIGPLPRFEADSFAAVYMEGVFEPGMKTAVHRHPGTEAWYTLTGQQCLETPGGKMVQKAGDPGVMVAGGEPMILVGIGTGIRRSLVLILQDATRPRSMLATDWVPKGLC